MEDIDRKIKKNGALCGIALGVFILLLNLFSIYFTVFIASSLLVIAIIGPLFITYILPFIAGILICNYLRKKIGGYWSFRQATTGFFVLFFLAFWISTGGKILYLEKINPEMKNKIANAFIKANVDYMQSQHKSRVEINKRNAEIISNSERTNQMSFGGLIQGFLLTILIIFIVSLIFAAFYKNERPLLASSDDEIDATV